MLWFMWKLLKKNTILSRTIHGHLNIGCCFQSVSSYWFFQYRHSNLLLLWPYFVKEMLVKLAIMMKADIDNLFVFSGVHKLAYSKRKYFLRIRPFDDHYFMWAFHINSNINKNYLVFCVGFHFLLYETN